MGTRKDIAILFFSRTAEAEGRAKAWLGSAHAAKNARIARHITHMARGAARQAGLPIWHCTQDEQVGTTFGERLVHAFAHMFAQGYQAVIAVGNDCPGLRRVAWSAVIAALQDGQQVLGRTRQGGAYLMGLQAGAFDPAALSAVQWQCATTYDSLQEALGRSTPSPVIELPVQSELNSRRDILHYAMQQLDALGKWLLSLVARSWAQVPLRAALPAQPLLLLRGVRGPPHRLA